MTPELRKRVNRYFLRDGWFKTIVPGSRIVAVGTRNCEHQLTQGSVYTAINGYEEGYFESRPFVSVIGDDGIKLNCHLSRFLPEFDE